VPNQGRYELLLNTDAAEYNGSDFAVKANIQTESVSSEGLEQSLLISLPPLATVFYKLK
jgi:1,4-alpha-glucan branching enzyme